MDSEFANAVELSYECAPLLESLKEYSEKDIACFDVSGHVKNRGVDILNKYLGESIMKMDINSSPTMDNVSAPNGVIRNAQDLDLPPSAISLGADMVAVSIHKTGGALTQSSALLLNRNNVRSEKVLQSINMLQSTSASYLLMASIDGARVNLVENGEKQLSKALNLSRYAKSRLNKIDGIKVLSTEILKQKGVKFIDETKLCINVKELNLTGFEVYDLLYKNFSIQVELGDSYNILALVSIGTNKSNH
ncbi:hypothetical protein [Clostridioides sp. ES-S-0108-01]|uniref:hypothetical protein n=1 Tax=Clostridioides sp. ES-S-0108-01 TaxID=2770773 RepID=UPI001D0C93CF